MKVVAILDPSVGTENVGDEIIYDSVRREIDSIFDNPLAIRISSHEFMLWESKRLLKKAEHIFLGGSNLLEPRMEWNIQWKLTPLELFGRLGAISLGCGWKHYGRKPTAYTRMLYPRALSGKYLNSVRDEMTRQQLIAAGVPNVANTACVTMWTLTPEHCATSPQAKADTVVTTLTEYHADRENDRFMLEQLFANYKRVLLFVQQPEDFEYARDLAPRAFDGVAASLKAYDAMLAEPCDYVGTRLHGGMRALQKGRRTLIVGIDNRAAEIGRDTDLPTVARKDLRTHLKAWIDAPYQINLRIPFDAIAQWRGQFA